MSENDTEVQNPNDAVIHTPTSEDFQQLFAMNPLAAAQLEAIIWKRVALSTAPATVSKAVDAP